MTILVCFHHGDVQPNNDSLLHKTSTYCITNAMTLITPFSFVDDLIAFMNGDGLSFCDNLTTFTKCLGL